MAEAECQDCLPGYHCDVPGLAYPSGLCEAGYYCTGGSNSSNPTSTTATGGPCPAGSFCVIGSSQPQLCPAGTYSSLTQQSNCTVCPAGYHCTQGSSAITDCPTGEWWIDVEKKMFKRRKIPMEQSRLPAFLKKKEKKKNAHPQKVKQNTFLIIHNKTKLSVTFFFLFLSLPLT